MASWPLLDRKRHKSDEAAVVHGVPGGLAKMTAVFTSSRPNVDDFGG